MSSLKSMTKLEDLTVQRHCVLFISFYKNAPDVSREVEKLMIKDGH
jgi:hypothetical protein